MTRKFSFIAFSLILIGFIFIIPSFADNDIDMNINGNSAVNSSASSNTTTNGSSTTTSNNSYSTPTYYSNSARVSTSNSDDEFGLSNILNIMLIVIGILLVLLAIAILIRLKN